MRSRTFLPFPTSPCFRGDNQPLIDMLTRRFLRGPYLACVQKRGQSDFGRKPEAETGAESAMPWSSLTDVAIARLCARDKPIAERERIAVSPSHAQPEESVMIMNVRWSWLYISKYSTGEKGAETRTFLTFLVHLSLLANICAGWVLCLGHLKKIA